MLSSLNVSQTGLNAAKIAVENVSNNIANENTPGYKKRVVQINELEQMDDRFTGRGVNASSSYRITSQYTYDKYMAENTKVSYYDKLSNMIGNVESIFKETDTSGFSSDLNRYFQSLENLRTNPNSEIYKTSLKDSGNIVVESLQNLYTSVEKQQIVEKTELSANVTAVNGILKEIATINEKIEKYSGVANDLLDKRDQLELELSNYVDISVNRDNGYYELKIAGEFAISNNTNVRTITVIEDETPQIDKFNNIKYNNDKNNTYVVYDSIKYDSDYNARSFASGDKITYKLNNELEVSVTIGEVIPDMTKSRDSITGEYPPLDVNGDGNPNITEDELIRALVFKINSNADTKNLITAYNGDYSLDSNDNKVLNTSQDKFLRIESVNEGLKSSFDGRIYIEEQERYSTYSPERGDIVSFKNVEANSDLYKALQDNTKFINNGNGTYTTTALTGEIKILENETIQKKFELGDIIVSSDLKANSDLYLALKNPTKFTDNLNGTFTATANAGIIKVDLNESLETNKLIKLSYSANDIVNNATVNSGSQLETDLDDPLKFDDLGGGFYKALTTGTTDLQLGESIEKLNADALSIPAGSIINVQNLVGGNPLDTLLSGGDFTDLGGGNYSINLSSGPISRSDFLLSAGESISISFSEKISLPNNFSYEPPSSYDGSMIDTMTIDGDSVTWDSSTGLIKDASNDVIALAKEAVLSFNVTGTQAGNKVDIKAGDIITIINDFNGISMSEQILEENNWVDNGDGTYISVVDRTITFDDANDEIKITRKIGTNIAAEQQSKLASTLFESKIVTTSVISDENMTTGDFLKDSIYRNEEESKDSESEVSIGIYDKEIPLKSGLIKAQIDNLSSTSANNQFQVYLDKLDSFAQTLSDISSTYIKSGNNEYIYGSAANDESEGVTNNIGLFSGSDIKTLKFNKNLVNDLNQDKLDYLATLQWKTDLSFDGLGQENEKSAESISLTEFFRGIRVEVSADKENNDFLKETQENVKQSIFSTYEQLTKVDKDEEMLNLIKFQSAYEANAKVISTINEMLQTLLNLKR